MPKWPGVPSQMKTNFMDILESYILFHGLFWWCSCQVGWDRTMRWNRYTTLHSTTLWMGGAKIKHLLHTIYHLSLVGSFSNTVKVGMRLHLVKLGMRMKESNIFVSEKGPCRDDWDIIAPIADSSFCSQCSRSACMGTGIIEDPQIHLKYYVISISSIVD